MRALLALLLALSACRGDTRSAPATKPSTSPAPPPAADPWNAPASSDDPPTLGERHRIADEACPLVKAPFFYRIEKAGKISHILGTRHLGVPLAKFPPAVHDALGAAKLVVFEVAPDDDEDGPSREIALRDELGPELWERYRALVGSAVARGVERAAPSMAMIQMIALYEDISATLDLEIERKVLDAHVPTTGLESSLFQDELLDRLLDLRMLRATVEHTKDRKELAEESRKDLAEYCAGTDDVPGIDDDMRADLRDSGYADDEIKKIDEEMVFGRNARWIPKLEQLLANDHVFIAVGADHLTGPRGVVALLAARGFKLTRVAR